MKEEIIEDIIYETIYRSANYPHVGNDYILASNWILHNYGIKDIDAICNLAKFIELNCTYDRNISEKDFKIILKEIIKLARKYKLEKIENYE